MSYRVIERTLCGGRDLFSHTDPKVVAKWLVDQQYTARHRPHEADVYILTPENQEIDPHQIKGWCNKQLHLGAVNKFKRFLQQSING